MDKKIIILIIIVIFISATLIVYFKKTEFPPLLNIKKNFSLNLKTSFKKLDLATPSFTNIYLKDKIIKAEIVKKPEEMAIGLSKYDDLAEDQGMLFLFSKKTKPAFWMKGMKFAIDIIWLDDDKIVDLTPNLLPTEEKLIIYKPKKPVNKVLEVKAGFIEENNLKIGDEIIIK
ncbi:MAG: DUF192 domain-containing protein [Patescibacteria group bacterium]